MLLIIDNHDSFTWNLHHVLAGLYGDVRVVRSDRVEASEAIAMGAAGVVLSPGPGTPAEAFLCGAIVRALPQAVPLLGVCLGHQVLCVEAGARLVRSTPPVHGKASRVRHGGRGLFAGLPSPFVAGRYHSLTVAPETVPAELEVVARADDGEIMGVHQRGAPRWGVQFHPESFLTPGGDRLLENFVDAVRAGTTGRAAVSA